MNDETKSTSGKPRCAMIGEDGNVFAIIGRVRRALRRAGQPERMEEFSTRASNAKSYDEVLQILHEYVEVE